MLGEGSFIGEQLINKAGTLVRRSVGGEGPHGFHIGQQADEIEMHPAEKCGVIKARARWQFVSSEVVVNDPVDGIVATGNRCRECWIPRAKRWLVGRLLEGEIRLPFCPGGDPRFNNFHLLVIQRLALRWHPQILVVRGNQFQDETFRRIFDVNDRSVFRSMAECLLGVHRKTALLFRLGVTFDALLTEDGRDLMDEVRCGGKRASRHEESRPSFREILNCCESKFEDHGESSGWEK